MAFCAESRAEAGELERRAGVVVEAAHEPGVERRLDAERGQPAANPLEVVAAVVADEVEQHRTGVGHRHALLALAVEDAQRVLGPGRAVLVAELGLVARQVVAQQLDVGRAALAVAHRVDVEADPGHADRGVEARGERDDLDVDRGVVGAERLDAELVVLAVAPGLGPLVAEGRRDVPRLPRGRRARAGRTRAPPGRCPRGAARRRARSGPRRRTSPCARRRCPRRSRG